MFLNLNMKLKNGNIPIKAAFCRKEFVMKNNYNGLIQDIITNIEILYTPLDLTKNYIKDFNYNNMIRAIDSIDCVKNECEKILENINKLHDYYTLILESKTEQMK
jgi:hypothetical protein